MEFKVKEVSGGEQKSRAEVEEQLLAKAAAANEGTEINVEGMATSNESAASSQEQETIQPQGETQTQSSELNEEDVLSYIKNRYDKQIDSVGQLFEEKESNEELPEDVSAYFEYKKKTGRGIEDYVKLNQDFDSMDEKTLLKSYFLSTEEGLDSDDVDVLLDDYKYDEDVDDETDIKKIKLAKKKVIGRAKKFFNEQKEMYKQPLESSTADLSESEKKEREAYNQYLKEANSFEEDQKRRRNWFVEKTDEVFSDFKGFDFKVGEDQVLTYTPTNVDDIKKQNLDTSNFMKKFVDENGLISDATGFHKALAIATNPERYAKFFYEQGLSAGTEGVTKKMKNINMSERRAPEVSSKGGVQVKSLNADNGRGLKIKKIKRL
tara:strand:- start:2757 stop:3890 length:1134 start_codon:yes stop_codon:yes gene_type:complete